ncbi:MAG: 3-oxoacyl-[acyl-carrier-protein] reductase [Bacillota bacterium]|nr:3-oxoacyl-[acyl-carrier-protein] reductase [Bacillota bacterium]
MRLNGKTALITGGANGIGKATAKRFLEEGATVIICDISEDALAETVSELELLGPITARQVDVTNEAMVQAMVNDIIEQYKTIDILINNAGITADARLVKMTSEQFDKVINVNLRGVFLCTRAIAPHMIENGAGRIINAASVVGLYGNFGQTNYAATKAGLIAMTRTWAKELGRKNICVNAVAPGFILTDMVRKMPEDVLEKMRAKTPMQRLGTVEEVASVYCFLASDESSYINGATISVDGAITL